MSHLCLTGSHLIKGQNYTENEQVNSLITDPEYHSVILYPGQQSTNLSTLSESDRSDYCLKNKKLRIFVIDGTWATARRMVRQSENIKNLPRICFSPKTPSNFRVRKQPDTNCYSTIEAIHHTIDLLSPTNGFPEGVRPHDHLIEIFNSMVERQLTFLSEVDLKLRACSYRRHRAS